MRIAVELIFYILINIVPPGVDQFQAEATLKRGNTQKKVLMNFTRQVNGHWKTTSMGGTGSDQKQEFWFSGDLATYHEKTGNRQESYPFGKRFQITTNHKKWKKVKKVTYSLKAPSGKTAPKVAFQFKVSKKGKKQYEVKAIGKDEEIKYFPRFRLSWK